jgi:hypothetical protein
VFANMSLQKSMFSSKEVIDFTANCTVTSKAAWADLLRVEPWHEKTPVGVGMGGLGHLMPERSDVWWTVRAGADWTSVADEVVSAVRDHFVPEIERRLALSDDELYRLLIDPGREFDVTPEFRPLRYGRDVVPFIDTVMDAVFREGSMEAFELFAPKSVTVEEVARANAWVLSEHGPLERHGTVVRGRISSADDYPTVSPDPIPTAEFRVLAVFSRCEAAATLRVTSIDNALRLLRWDLTVLRPSNT